MAINEVSSPSEMIADENDYFYTQLLISFLLSKIFLPPLRQSQVHKDLFNFIQVIFPSY